MKKKTIYGVAVISLVTASALAIAGTSENPQETEKKSKSVEVSNQYPSFVDYAMQPAKEEIDLLKRKIASIIDPS